MPTNKTTATNYMVMGFVLAMGEDGKPVHKTVQCGAFSSVEEAFGLARELAEGQWRQLAEAAAEEGPSVELEIYATEHGYDIRRGALVMERFWVHDKKALEALSV